ncbi:unnamed protein product [Heterosigma akashiwo]|mmetsp:Transcript_32409/g.55983  ORF Transcript_32409/g.55983 Transcript_32409/m.55983 type:complete len:531 (-) Transcript_32409:454-2046(-)
MAGDIQPQGDDPTPSDILEDQKCGDVSHFSRQFKRLYLVYRNHPEAYWPTVGFFGVQMCWAVQITYVSSYLITLGMTNETVGFAWLAGPLSGIIVQPIVGLWSDHSESKWGRRRPYIIFGTVCSVIGLLGFSNAEAFGYWLGDSGGSHPAGLVLAIFFFFFMDFAINYAMGPMVALLADTASTEVYPYGQAWFAAHNGLGKTVGYALGSISLTSLAAFAWLGSNLRALFLLAAVGTAAASALMALKTPEVPHRRPGGAPRPAAREVLAEIWAGLTQLPLPIHRAFVVQCFSYFAWDTTFIYVATWMGETVYGGGSDSSDSDYGAYEDGVEAASLGYMGMAIISVLWAMVLPMLGRLLGVRLLWALNLLLFALILVLFATVRTGQRAYAVFLVTLLGFPLAGTYQIPWAIVTVVAEETPEKVALLTTIFNMSQCFPEIIVSLIGGSWIDLCGEWLGSIFLLGAAGALGAAALCYTVVQPPNLYDRKSVVPVARGPTRTLSGEVTEGAPLGQAVEAGGARNQEGDSLTLNLL